MIMLLHAHWMCTQASHVVLAAWCAAPNRLERSVDAGLGSGLGLLRKASGLTIVGKKQVMLEEDIHQPKECFTALQNHKTGLFLIGTG